MTKKEEATMELYRMIRPIERNLEKLRDEIFGAKHTKSKYPYEITQTYFAFEYVSQEFDWILSNLEDASSLQEDEILETEEDYEEVFEGIDKKLKKSSALLDAYMVEDEECVLAEFMKSIVTHAQESLGRLNEIKLESEEKVG